jgi:hypothetical protein
MSEWWRLVLDLSWTMFMFITVSGAALVIVVGPLIVGAAAVMAVWSAVSRSDWEARWANSRGGRSARRSFDRRR